MSYLTSNILPAIQVLRFLSNTSKFQNWLERTHPTIKYEDIFFGYHFCVKCCISNFFDAFAGEEMFGLSTSDQLNYSYNECIPLRMLENDCEKIIVLKNIQKYVKAVNSAKTYEELVHSMQIFNQDIALIFERFSGVHITATKKSGLSKKDVTTLSLVHFVHAELNQVKNPGPQAYEGTLTDNPYPTEYQLERGFEGYKLAVQFIWTELIGEAEVENSCLKNIHTSDSWSKYIYEQEEPSGDFDLVMYLSRTYDLEKQTCFDSYYKRISEEILPRFNKIARKDLYDVYREFKLNKKGYIKEEYFSKLLDSTGFVNPFNTLSWNEKFRNRIYWQSCQVIDGENSDLHVGVPTFNIMLAGCVALLGNDTSIKKVIVARFSHPLPNTNDKYEYSYGIFIDRQATGRNYRGWVIYARACSDNSGFSGSEHKAAEELIKKYKRERKISLRELTISWINFEPLIRAYIKTTDEVRLMNVNSKMNDKLSLARGHVFELFVYYLWVNNSSNFKITLNTDKKTGEKDIVLMNEKEVKIIECKTNPQSHDLINVASKLSEYLKTFQQPKKSFELWFWENASKKSEAILLKENILFEEVQTRKHPFLKNVDISLLNTIMEDVEHSNFNQIPKELQEWIDKSDIN